MKALHLTEIIAAVKGTAIWLCGDESYNENTICIETVSTNSRDSLVGGLFVPIQGERVDAHDYIVGAFQNGAVASFTSRHQTMEDVMNDPSLSSMRENESTSPKVLICVANTLDALQTLATYYRNQFQVPIIGISGSVGKTTTKEMIAAALQTKQRVLKTFGNMNSQIGLSLMMFELDESYDVAVIEMGISEPMEMERLCRIAQPKYAVLTNIGVSHIANLKTRENIRKEKSNIANCFQSDSILYVNGNDELLLEIYENYVRTANGKDRIGLQTMDLCETTKQCLSNARVTAFGTHTSCTFRAEDVVTKEEQTSFTLVYPDGREQIDLSVCGIHNVYNAVVALAIAYEFGIHPSDAKRGLFEYRPMDMRGQIVTLDTLKVIDDTYNASPDSMKSGIQVLLDLSGVRRRIAVLADVLELGEFSQHCHYEVGTFLSKTNVDVLITVGTQASYIAQAVHDSDSNMEVYSFATNEQVNSFLNLFVEPNDGILVKGSRGMHTEQIVAHLRERWSKRM